MRRRNNSDFSFTWEETFLFSNRSSSRAHFSIFLERFAGIPKAAEILQGEKSAHHEVFWHFALPKPFASAIFENT